MSFVSLSLSLSVDFVKEVMQAEMRVEMTSTIYCV